MTATSTRAGWELFARYARAPNTLGFCGPPGGLGASEAEVRAAARRFSGAWPYLQVMARVTGTSDPLAHRLVEAYWLGRDLGIDRRAFGAELLAVLGPQAGHHWTHLASALTADPAPDHGFHVFEVYPWSRLLGRPGAGAQPLEVLDGCRIRCARVLSRTADAVVVHGRVLTWDGTELGLAEPAVERMPPVPGVDPEPGEQVALHWGTVCDRLTAAQAADLEASTAHRLAATNCRLARECA